MKKSFSLIETLASIIILSIVISSFSNISINKTDYLNFVNIQKLKNELNSNTPSDFLSIKVDTDYNIQDNSTLKFIHGSTYNKYIYDNREKLIYYDIPYKKSNLASKTY